MRWDELFADLEAEVAAESETERRAEVADRIKVELGRLRLIDRLHPSLHAPGLLRVGLAGQPVLSGSLQALGVDWLLLRQESGAEWLVALAAVQAIQGLRATSAEPGWEGRVGARLDLRVALRQVARDRSRLTMGLCGGELLNGRLSRIGADHIELADSATGGGVRASWTVPLIAIAFVQRR